MPMTTRARRSDRTRRHPAICAACSASTSVPFLPSPDRPVYCAPCHQSRRHYRPAAVTSPVNEPATGHQSRRHYPPAAVTSPVNEPATGHQSRRHYRPAAVTSPVNEPATGHQSRRHYPPAAVTSPVIEPVTGHESRNDTANAVDSVFPGMALKATTRQSIARMDIFDPTPIQEKTIPHLLEGRDLIGQARTGSGKTLAFAVPMVEQCDPSVRRIQALVLVPTRELAIQVAEVTKVLASSQRLRVTLLYGGRSLRPECAALRSGAQIIIGTPGRTLDHIRQGNLDLRSVRFMVLDEADEMLDKGFAHDVEAILGETPSERQTALMSATMPEWVAKTAAKYLKDPVVVEVDADLRSLPAVEHLVYNIRKSDKIEVLQDLLNERRGAMVIVFGRTKHGVKKLAKRLDNMGYPVGALQGNLSQNARERVMKDFRSGDAPILVATNVAARGLDVDGIEQIINYDLPDTELLFTHRVGRTGRMGRSGEAVTLITPDEERKWREIERSLGRRFKRMPWVVTGQKARSRGGYE